MAASRSRGRRFLAYLFLQLSCAIAVRAQVSLNQLTACDDLARTQSAVRSWIDSAPHECRSPSNLIERTLIARSHAPRDSVCFLREPPSPSLSRFNCMLIRSSPAAEMTCFRPARLSDLREYEADFQGHNDAASVDYMKQAAKCSVSTGDTGASYPTVYPYLLMFVSRPEFGFISGVKPDARGSSYVVHAFARVDPSLRDAPDAIEAVSWVAGASIPKEDPQNIHRTNGWRIVVDADLIPTQILNRAYRQRNVPLQLKSLDISLSRPADFSGHDKERIERLHAELVRGLEAEGFDEEDQDNLRLSNGKSLQEALVEMEAQSPYGMRKLYSVAERRGPFTVLTNAKRLACASRDRGALVAAVFANKPDPDEASDYGAVSLVVGGVGDCAHLTGATGRYLRGLLNDAEKRVLNSLE